MRPQIIDPHKLGLVQTLFWIQIAKKLHHVDLIISVDETTLNRSTYNSYEWGSKEDWKRYMQWQLAEESS